LDRFDAAGADIDLVQLNKQIAAAQRSISRLIDAYESALLEPRVRQAKERMTRPQQEASAAWDRATHEQNFV
jgi:hypothetical protein